MKVEAASLITDLIERTRQVLDQTTALQQLSFEELNWKADADTWSILECLEHLNRYGDFYTPEIRKRINNSDFKTEPYFKSSLLGNYFAKIMLPGEKMNKMKTLKSMNPVGSALDMKVLDRFLDHQTQMLDLLHAAKAVNLTKTKTSISISSWLKLRLGDTLRVVIFHNQRHLAQANSIWSQLKKLEQKIV